MTSECSQLMQRRESRVPGDACREDELVSIAERERAREEGFTRAGVISEGQCSWMHLTNITKKINATLEGPMIAREDQGTINRCRAEKVHQTFASRDIDPSLSQAVVA